MKTFTGTVISTKMEKTAVVEVERQWIHPVYKKTVRSSKKYMVHDEKGVSQVGETVSFTECKPISKNKRFMLVTDTKEK